MLFIRNILKLGGLRFPNPGKSVDVYAMRGCDLSLGMVPPSTRNVDDECPRFFVLGVSISPKIGIRIMHNVWQIET